MIRVLHKSKPYAFIKGLKDAGINIKCKEEFFPEKERIYSEKFKNKIEEIKKKIKLQKKKN